MLYVEQLSAFSVCFLSRSPEGRRPRLEKDASVHVRGVIPETRRGVRSRIEQWIFFDSSNKCHASSNKCLTSSNKKLVETSFLIYI